MKNNSRYIAFKMIEQTLLEKKSFEEVQRDFEIEDSRDQRFIHHLYLSFFRFYGQNLEILRLFFKTRRNKYTATIKIILCCGLTEFFQLRSETRAVVHSWVDVSKTLMPSAFSKAVNGVLREIDRQKDSEQIIAILNNKTINLPLWLKTKLRKTISKKQTKDLAEIQSRQPPLDLTLKNTNTSFQIGSFLEPATSRLSEPLQVEKIEGFEQGEWWVQDFAATLPIYLFDSIDNQDIHDFCAAPGGKSMQLASLGAKVFAYDISEKRLDRIHENAERTKLKINIIQQDILELPTDRTFKNILLDAPCSATGTIRRHPELPWIKGMKDVEPLLKKQQDMLNKAADLLEIGGSLIYCVCSILPEEGEVQISKFLESHQNFKLTVPESFMKIVKTHKLNAQEKMIRSYPFHAREKGGMDGFFYCRLDKIS